MGVTQEQIDQICAALPGAEFVQPPELTSWKVGGKMFACFAGDGNPSGVSVKCADIETARMLIDAGLAQRAPYFHASWVRLPLDATDLGDARHRLVVSYDIVRGGLKKAARDALPTRGDF